MKVFLGTDRRIPGAGRNLNEFCVAAVSEQTMAAYNEARSNSEKMNRKAKLPLPLRLFKGLMIMMTFIIGLSVPAMLPDIQEACEALFVFGFCLGIVRLLNRAARRRMERVTGSEEGRSAAENFAAANADMGRELGVPADAVNVDVFAFDYRTDDCAIAQNPCSNLQLKAWAADDALYLAALERKFAFPLREMQGIRMKEQNLSLKYWNKPVAYNKGEYAEYGITRDDEDNVYCIRKYCILELVRGDERWGVFFPEYELPVFRRLTGIEETV